ncbi:MAG: response regulator [Bdellovibrionaceae bacterium]|nr:response regulator [Pseudobdellovibrionaceae bacterium]
MHGKDSTKILILSAGTPDAEKIENILNGFGISCRICGDTDALLQGIQETAGAVIVTKDALDNHSLRALNETLHQQPQWSFLPILMILSRRDLQSPETLDLLKPLPNLTLLEQPVLPRVLLSIVQAALAERKRQYELRDSLHEAIEANRAKSEFLANMSHEIRTPLGVILGFSELLAEGGLSEENRKAYLGIVQRNGQLLSAIVNDVLDLAKVEAGRLQIELIETSLDEMLSEVTSALKIRAKDRELQLLVERDPRLPGLIKTDPIRLRQILFNIIGNAVKFTPKGSVKISVCAREAPDGNETGKLLVFRVTDTGIGLKPEQASLLFQTFSQADGSITRRFGGTGLGLALSQKLARALGGDVKLVESRYEQGSTFEISIALHEARTTAAPFTNHAAPAPVKDLALRGLHVLVVDDSKDNQMLIGHLLNRAGVKTTFAENGEEGVKKALGLRPDVILMDVQMPVLSGIDATIHLRSQGCGIPIIALTAQALKGDREQCLASGFNDYLAKPVNRAELYEALRKTVEPSAKQPTFVSS